MSIWVAGDRVTVRGGPFATEWYGVVIGRSMAAPKETPILLIRPDPGQFPSTEPVDRWVDELWCSRA
jgi:hypothetical protein